MSILRDYRTSEQISQEDELLDMISERSGIERSRLSIGPLFLDPKEWHVDRRIRLDNRKVKIRWWKPSLMTDSDAIDELVQDLIEEIEYRIERESL